MSVELLSLPDRIAALGLGDDAPVAAVLQSAGASTAPMSPVHPSARSNDGGGRTYRWIRRSRGAWLWLDGYEAPLGEEQERYLVGAGPVDAPLVQWQVDRPAIELSGDAYAALYAQAAGQPVWVRQLGAFGQSPATLLDTVPDTLP